MKLLDVLKLIERDYFPPTIDDKGEIDSRPQSVFQVTICFMCEEETWMTCNIQNLILVPWYDCEVLSIHPDSDNKESICIWLKDEEYLKEHYPQHLAKELPKCKLNGLRCNYCKKADECQEEMAVKYRADKGSDTE